MLLGLSLLAVACVTWYTINIARVEWRRGNKWGAVGVGLLSLAVGGLPTYRLLFA